MRERVIAFSLSHEQKSKIKIRLGIFGVQLERREIMFHRLSGAAFLRKDIGEIVVRL